MEVSNFIMKNSSIMNNLLRFIKVFEGVNLTKV